MLWLLCKYCCGSFERFALLVNSVVLFASFCVCVFCCFCCICCFYELLGCWFLDVVWFIVICFAIWVGWVLCFVDFAIDACLLCG